MDNSWLLLCVNHKTDELRSFLASCRLEAEHFKADFLSCASVPSDWRTYILRSYKNEQKC